MTQQGADVYLRAGVLLAIGVGAWFVNLLVKRSLARAKDSPPQSL